MQVPKQGRNLHRESAFYVTLVAQVPALKWNLRHRGASVHFGTSAEHHIEYIDTGEEYSHLSAIILDRNYYDYLTTVS